MQMKDHLGKYKQFYILNPLIYIYKSTPLNEPNESGIVKKSSIKLAIKYWNKKYTINVFQNYNSFESRYRSRV